MDLPTIVSALELRPHPEGGYYRETYRSEGHIPEEALPAKMKGERNYATAIYFLLGSEDFSAFHKIEQDETWHFYMGSPLVLHMISPEGDYASATIGVEIDNGQRPQFTIPGGIWFAVEVLERNSFSLAGCTVAPGFDFADFHMPPREQLLAWFPQHRSIILRLSR